MRIAIVSGTPAQIALGSGTWVAAENLKGGLEALGHDVRLVTLAPSAGSFGYAWRRFWFNFNLRPADVSGCELVCGFDLDGLTLAGHPAPPYVAYLHGVIADEARFERGLTRWSLGLQARFERAAARRAARTLAPSRYSAGRIQELYGVESGRIDVVAPGFDVERWQQALGVAQSSPGEALTILCVARMYPRKNHSSLLRAVALLKPEFPTLRLRIIGDGPEHQRVRRLAERLRLNETVQFLGQVPFGRLVAEYAASDVFCLPSLQEGFGLVFAEAMTAGKPIAACQAGATPEVVTPGENGLLSPPGDDHALARDLAVLLRDPHLRRRMGERNRLEAPRRFGLRPAAQRFLEAVAPLVAKDTRLPTE